MKRQYKFRAWDEKLKKMFYSGYGVGTFITNSRWWVIEQNDVNVASSTRENILMQYTGLKDKNGTDIYEGDILKDTLGWVFEVRWDNENGRFLGYHSKPRGDIYICYVGREPESTIIGNIWENPELLK